MSDDQKILITEEGLKKLEAEYQELTLVERPKMLNDLAQARSLGDLSENAAYSEARRRQSFIEGRIVELEQVIKNAEVFKKDKSGAVQLGSKVKLSLGGQEEEFLVVSANEADIAKSKVSIDSPLGQALKGKKAGEKAKVLAPAGSADYIIINVE